MNIAYWFDLNRFKSGEDHQFNLVWLFIFTVTIIFIGLGLREPWPADEPRFAQVAREMVETGQWFFPMRGGELYPDKPPVFMWSIAVFYYLLGSIKIAFLLPSAICSTLTTFLVYDLGRRYWSPQVGWRAAILLLLTVQFTLQAKTAQIDAMLCCWVTVACYGLLRHLLSEGDWRWYFFGCFFMGIGVITKGVGFLPLLMLIPYLLTRLLQRKEQEIQGSWQWGVGILALLAAVMLWFIPMLLLVESSNNPVFEQYRDNILFKQTATRYANPWHHIKPFWYYITSVVPVFWLPISLMIPWLFKPWKMAILAADRRIILPLGWIILVLVFFSISPGKRGVYILPALPMLALITAPYLEEILSSKWLNRIIWGVITLLGLTFVLTAITGLLELQFLMDWQTKYKMQPWWFLLSLGIIASFASLFSFKKAPFLSWVIFIPSLWILYSTWGYALRDPVKTPKPILAKIAQIAPADAELGIVGLKEQFLLFSPYQMTHFGYHTEKTQQMRKAWEWQGENNKRYILGFKKGVSECFDMSQAIPLGKAHRREWLLFNNESRSATCKPALDNVQAFTFQLTKE